MASISSSRLIAKTAEFAAAFAAQTGSGAAPECTLDPAIGNRVVYGKTEHPSIMMG
ncbi:MAG: hypothetical protein LBI39_02040 [Puniceicoccales bacterium]|nr:hypothetical protein [Puniceicoccales bacterium]